MIHVEAPTHRIPADKTDRDDDAGPHLTASADTYEKAREDIYAKVPQGYRLTWIRTVTPTPE